VCIYLTANRRYFILSVVLFVTSCIEYRVLDGPWLF